MSADQPLTGDDLANLRARARAMDRGSVGYLPDLIESADVLRLVDEIERRIPVPEGLDPERAAGALWRLACSPLQWVTGPYPDDWPLDGEDVIGEREAEAVREFQRANGLTVDGILGPQTWVALRARNESHPYDA